jgi:hypothetical protein
MLGSLVPSSSQVGQTVYSFYECGLDQSYIICPMTLDAFSVNKDGIYAVNVSNEHSVHRNMNGVDEYYLSLDELIEYCKEINKPYSIVDY